MNPGPDCVIAKRMVGDQYSKVPPTKGVEKTPGCWVCLGHRTDEETTRGMDHLIVFDGELEALRHAVQYTDRIFHDMRYLGWGQSYC